MGHRKEDLDALTQRFKGVEAQRVMSGLNLTIPQKLSGNRAQMFASHLEQMITLKNPESPKVFTGYEQPYGQYTDSRIKTEVPYRVIDVISRDIALNRFSYIYLVQDMLGAYDVINVVHFEKLSELHGYLRPMTTSDYFQPGSIIPPGTTIMRSNNHDEHENYRYGINAKVAYISIPETEEDGIVFSESYSKNIKFYMVNETEIVLNHNDCLLNLYGDIDTYKCFPDIGEFVKDGILCGKRKINHLNTASEMTSNALRRSMINDTLHYGKGQVVDIQVHVNNVDELINNEHRQQIMFYYLAQKAYYENVKKSLGSIVNNKDNKYSFEVKFQYEKANDFLSPEVKFSNNTGVFEFAHVVITTVEEVSLYDGYKVTDRYGGKGVICKIWPDEYMPVDEYGNRADVILSPPGTVARANPGQLYEHELNFISNEIRKRMAKLTTLDAQFTLLQGFLADINPKEAAYFYTYWNGLTEEKRQEVIAETIHEGIMIHQGPFYDNLSLDQLENLYSKYDVKPSRVRIRREFPFGDTMIKDNIPAKELVDEELTFYFSQKQSLRDLSGVSPHHGTDVEGYLFDDQVYIPDGEGGVKTLSAESLYNHVVSYGDSKQLNFEDKVRAYRDERGMLVREFVSQRPVVIADKFMIVLKHVPETKFSARSVGATNQIGIPSKAGKPDNVGPYSNTPIKFGEMELDNALIRVPEGIVHRLLATHATNPALRTKLVEMLLSEDPFEAHDLPVDDDGIEDDVPALELDTFLFTIGIDIG